MERIPTIYFLTNSIIERAQNNMKKYKISVLVCAYNTGAYINRCVNSILQQSYQNIEIHSLDNGSVDNTWEIITGLQDDRIHKYRVVQNTGVENGYKPVIRWYVVSIKKLVSFIVYIWALPLCNFKNLRK